MPEPTPIVEVRRNPMLPAAALLFGLAALFFGIVSTNLLWFVVGAIPALIGFKALQNPVARLWHDRVEVFGPLGFMLNTHACRPTDLRVAGEQLLLLGTPVEGVNGWKCDAASWKALADRVNGTSPAITTGWGA